MENLNKKLRKYKNGYIENEEVIIKIDARLKRLKEELKENKHPKEILQARIGENEYFKFLLEMELKTQM